jgi:hypothetical protein
MTRKKKARPAKKKVKRTAAKKEPVARRKPPKKKPPRRARPTKALAQVDKDVLRVSEPKRILMKYERQR